MAKTTTCSQCKTEIPKTALKCMHCGSKQQTTPPGLKVLAVLFGLWALGSILDSTSKTSAPSKSPEQIAAENKATKERLAAEREKLQAEFNQNRDQIISDVKNLTSAGKHDEAVELANRYTQINDATLNKLKDQAWEQVLLARVKGIPASEVKVNRDMYSQLAAIDPNNDLYKKKLEHYQSKLDEQIAEREARRLAFGEPPVRSAWDGSYREVERYLKVVAHDPDSIDIEQCTDVYHTKKGWLVGCAYRGKNAFGGKVLNSNWFTIVKGQVVNMESSDRYQW